VLKIVLTKHANLKKDAEGISLREIEECIKRGSKFVQTDGLLAKYRYIRVAYKQIRGVYLIKTVFVQRYGD